MSRTLIYKPKDNTWDGAAEAARAANAEKVAGILHHRHKQGCYVVTGDDWDLIDKFIDDTNYSLVAKVKEKGEYSDTSNPIK